MKNLPPTGLIIEENPAIAAAIRDYQRCGGVLDIRTCTSADSAPNHRQHLRAATYTLHSVIAARSAERQQLAACAGADAAGETDERMRTGVRSGVHWRGGGRNDLGARKRDERSPL